MLTPARIARLARANDWDRLLKDVLANGRPLPASAAARLAQPSCVRAAAAALGLCRSLELARAPYGPDRSPVPGVDPALLDALRASADSGDPVARAFAHAALRAIGRSPAALPARRGPGAAGPLFQQTMFTEEESGGALSGEGSPLDALLEVWALGGVFVCSPDTLAERSDRIAAFDAASRSIDAMSPRSPLAADLRVMRALAAVALRRSTALRPAA